MKAAKLKLGVLFSGGKDSLYAAYLAEQRKQKYKGQEKNSVACLITIISKNPDSYMFHTPNINLAEMQAEALGLPLVRVKSKGEKEKELQDLRRAIKTAVKKYKIEGIVSGAVASTYQKTRIKRICDELDIAYINPLWHRNQTELLGEIVKAGFKVIITQIGAEGFDESWLGKEINQKTIDELKILNKKYKINVAFEGGECETFVTDSPLHKKKIEILETEKTYSNYSGRLEIKKARLAGK